MLPLVLVALLAGALLPVQAGVNVQLRGLLGNPIVAAFVSFAVGTLCLLAYLVAVRPETAGWAGVVRTSWWHWTGGLLGTLLVVSSIVLAPRLGASVLFALIVAGQLAASVLIDHFGLFGYPRRPADLVRLLGVALVCVGVVLATRARSA